MPTCPGCQQRVSYDRLPTHLNHCPALVGSADRDQGPSVDRLERRVDSVEQRLQVQESEMKRHLAEAVAGDAQGDLRTLGREQ